MTVLKPTPPLYEPQGRVKQGKAIVTWGPRMYGPPCVVANAPVDAIDDLVAALCLAREQLSVAEQTTDEGDD